MLKRFWKILALTKGQNEIELDGKHIVITKREKRLARIAQSVMEFIPLLAMFLIVGNPDWLHIENAASVLGFLSITVVVFGIFMLGCVLGFLIWRIGMNRYL